MIKNSPASHEILGMSMGEFAIAVVTLLLVLVGVPLAIEAIRRMWLESRARHLLIRSESVTKFDPIWVVPTYGSRGFREYWPTTVEGALDEAFMCRENTVLIGRPQVGKSRAAVHHLKKHFGKRWPWARWRVLQPLPEALDALSTLRIPKQRYVLLLDDLDVYLRRDESRGGGFCS